MPVSFRYTRMPLSPAGAAAYHSVIKPLCGVVNTQTNEIVKAIQHIRGRWILRSKELSAAGWAACTEDKLEFACNCPPVPVQIVPRTRPCSLRICPFCHARHVMRIYRLIHGFIRDELKGETVRVAARSYALGHKRVPEPLYVDDNGTLSVSLHNLLNRHRPLRNMFRRQLRQTHGGIYWYTVTPVIAEGRLADDSVGNWLIRHSCVAIGDGRWNWDFLNKKAILRENPDDYTLAWMVGYAFRYQRYWLSTDAPFMANFLEQIAAERFQTTFGRLRGR